MSSAELYRPDPYTYGRFEARVRYAAGSGVISSFFLWKEGSEMPGAYWNEIDFEKLGANCALQTNLIYNKSSPSHENKHPLSLDLCGAYHDYSLEWTPEYIAFFVDGQEIRRATGADAKAFADNASGGMTFHFNVWPGNANFGGTFDPTILPVHQYISWAQYSSYANGQFQLVWREEFDGNTLPSGWMTGTWESAYKLSTHADANVNFVDGAAVLSLTADDATGFKGQVPPDAGSSGAGGVAAGGTSASAGSSAAGSGGLPSASAGAAATSPTPSDSDGGCSVRTGGAPKTGAGFGAALGLALFLRSFWRRRASSRPTRA